MNVVIIGGETPLVQALICELDSGATCLRVVGRKLHGPAGETIRRPEQLQEFLECCDTLIFCGGAADSSWNTDFGDFHIEHQWLQPCIDSVGARDGRLIMISSDAVLTGPAMFHSDDSTTFASDAVATELRAIENTVAAVTNSLVVRTHVVGETNRNDSCCGRALSALRRNRKVEVDAGVFATPLSAADFAAGFCAACDHNMTGYLNIGGAERTSPFHFVTHLARADGLDCDLIEPVSASRTQERALRNDRLRMETGYATSVLRETIEAFAAKNATPELATPELATPELATPELAAA